MKKTVRVVRVVVLVAAVYLQFRILSNGDRNNWFALIPGALLALAVGHRVTTVRSRRQISKQLAAPRPIRPTSNFAPDPELFPFESKWFESSVGRIHYIDEWTGDGDGRTGRPLLLMHGNPDWSFLYRKMIPLLSDDFRCISIDYPGFGLSDHPSGGDPTSHSTEYRYRPQDHARIVSELIEHLDLHDAVLVGQDWGGPIGMDVASRDPDRFTGLVLGNTFFFPALKLQRMFGAIMNSDIMRHQVMKRSLFVRRMLPALLQTEPTAAEFAHYDDVAPTYASRIGHATFLASITGEREWLAQLEQRVDATLLDRPMLRVLGLKDKPLTTREFLAKWDEKFPDATTLDLPDAGHFWQEDEPEAVAGAIQEAFAVVPASGS